jgi:hypothetical protein
MAPSAPCRSIKGVAGQLSSAYPCDGSCGTSFCTLPGFPQLKKLFIKSVTAVEESRTAIRVYRALRTAARTQISELELYHCWRLRVFSTLTGAKQLSVLKAKMCGLSQLSGLINCAALTDLDVLRNWQLRSLSAVPGAVQLERLTARNCVLHNVDGLDNFSLLAFIDVLNYPCLQSLWGLAGAPSLQTVIAHS